MKAYPTDGGPMLLDRWLHCTAAVTLCLALAGCSAADGGTEPDGGPAARSVRITMPNGAPRVGVPIQLVATAYDGQGRPVDAEMTWLSTHQHVATVSQDGLVTPIAFGMTTVHASIGTRYDTVRVVVARPVLTMTDSAVSYARDLEDVTLQGGKVLQLQNVGISYPITLQLGAIEYSPQTPTPWLTATLTAGAPPANVQLAITSGQLPAGRYDAVVPVLADIDAPNADTTLRIRVRLQIGGYADVSAGATHTCALTQGGVAWCWGENGTGELGDGTDFNRSVPVRVQSSERFTQMSSGHYYTCARTAGGAAWCWGTNFWGELGNGTREGSGVPTLVTGGHNFAEVRTSSGSHTCGREVNGTVRCWGSNNYGQTGTLTSGPYPQPVISNTAFRAIALGTGFTCGLALDGQAYCWGYNFHGQLGDGTTTNRATPTPVQTALRFVEIEAGREHVCARTSAGTVHCWGRNKDGVLGTGLPQSSSVPVAVNTSARFIDLHLGGHSSQARTQAGALYSWGHGQPGMLTSTTPRLVQGFGSGDGAYSNGHGHACRIEGNGKVYCWGSNQFGQLGTGASGQFNIGFSQVLLP